jgi:hypothetical protein
MGSFSLCAFTKRKVIPDMFSRIEQNTPISFKPTIFLSVPNRLARVVFGIFFTRQIYINNM